MTFGSTVGAAQVESFHDFGRLDEGIKHLIRRSLQACCSTVALTIAACTAIDSGPPRVPELTVLLDSPTVLGTSDAVTKVVDLQPLPDGRVWVLNSTAPYFVVLAPDGQVERVFGESGGGPEEFDAPWVLVRGATPSDIWTFDVARSVLVHISGPVRREVPIQRDSTPPSSLISFKGAGINQAPPWLGRTQDGFVFAKDRTSQRETALQAWSADILLLEQDGRLSLHSPVADFVGNPSERYGEATTLLPYPVWTVCLEGEVGLYDPTVNTLRRLTPDGEELAAFDLPTERRVEITSDRVFEMFYRQIQDGRPAGQLPPKEDVRRLTQDQNEELASNSAGVFPEYADLHCTADGAFWIRPFDVDAVLLGQGTEWIRFSADGTSTRFILPDGFRTFRIEGDRIWGSIPDSLGVESIVWVEVDGPS